MVRAIAAKADDGGAMKARFEYACFGAGRVRAGIGAGLDNLGNTCFMNSTLQCLMHCEPFARYCVRHVFRRLALNDPGRLSPSDLQDGKRLCMLGKQIPESPARVQPDAISTVFQTLGGARLIMNRTPGQGMEMSVSPHKLEATLPRLESGGLSRGRQHDAQEFLAKLIDTGEEDIRRAGLPWTQAMHFGLVNRVECSTCGAVSRKQDDSQALNLEIPGEARSVGDCLEAFFTDEILDGDNKYECEKCKEKKMGLQPARKGLRLPDAMPEMLVVHLKRFRFGAGGLYGGYRRKGVAGRYPGNPKAHGGRSNLPGRSPRSFGVGSAYPRSNHSRHNGYGGYGASNGGGYGSSSSSPYGGYGGYGGFGGYNSGLSLGGGSKIQTHLDFDEILQLHGLVEPEASRDEEQEGTGGASAAAAQASSSASGGPAAAASGRQGASGAAAGGSQSRARHTYRLRGIVVHAGSSSFSGHYFAYVKCLPRGWYKDRKSLPAEQWYCMNDSYVTPCGWDEVQRQQAYLVRERAGLTVLHAHARFPLLFGCPATFHLALASVLPCHRHRTDAFCTCV